jgi:HEPN domain-containing protein
MPYPNVAEVRRFLTTAKHRFEEAQLLDELGRTTAAIYLAGYAVECSLKALLLSSVPRAQCGKVLASFRGKQGHDYEWLKVKYIRSSGARFPPDIAKAFSLVDSWTTDLRYSPSEASPRESRRFLKSAEAITLWANERL